MSRSFELLLNCSTHPFPPLFLPLSISQAVSNNVVDTFEHKSDPGVCAYLFVVISDVPLRANYHLCQFSDVSDRSVKVCAF